MIDVHGIFKTNLQLRWSYKNEDPEVRYSVYKLIRRSNEELRWIYLESLTTLEMALSRYPNAVQIDGTYVFRGSLPYHEDQLK